MIKRLIAKWLEVMEQQGLARARQHVKQYTKGSFQ